MIALDVINDAEQHFAIRATEPMRVEILVIDGKVVAHVCEGDQTDLDQEPLGAYDGTIDKNVPWASPPLPRNANQRVSGSKQQSMTL